MVKGTAPTRARAFLGKAEQYLESAEDNLAFERYTAASGDAIHAGISAKDAIATALTGSTAKSRDHAAAGGELRRALGARKEASRAERALRELVADKVNVEYGAELATKAKAEACLRRARSLVALAADIARLAP
jgi:hypothetical protein